MRLDGWIDEHYHMGYPWLQTTLTWSSFARSCNALGEAGMVPSWDILASMVLMILSTFSIWVSRFMLALALRSGRQLHSKTVFVGSTIKQKVLPLHLSTCNTERIYRNILKNAASLPLKILGQKILWKLLTFHHITWRVL